MVVQLFQGWTFNESEARLALEALNRRVAAIYRQEPISGMNVVFTDMIEDHVVKDFSTGQKVFTRRTVGQCIRAEKLIRIVVRKGWQTTAVHEFVHLYNPGRGEAWIARASKDVARLLKHGGLWSEPVA